MSISVLDASALLAYLYNEDGADIVKTAIDKEACLSVVNWAEVLSALVNKGQDTDAIRSLDESGLIGEAVELMSFTREDARLVAGLRLSTKSFGLSLGDRSCLALAMRLKLPVVTADRTWKRLKLGLTIKCIR